MRVKVIKYSDKDYWYSNKIGKTYKVIDHPGSDYECAKKTGHFLKKSDCEIVEGEMIDKLVGVLPNCPLSELDIEQDDINGEHYRQMAIEPLDYSMANKHNPCQAKVIKYVSRYPFKGGIKDLRKAEKMLARLIEYEIGNEL